jgi:hypothetical protein
VVAVVTDTRTEVR